MIVKCTKYPELSIADLGVTFKMGAAEVEDARVLSKMTEMKDFGFEFAEEIPEVESPKSEYDQLKEKATTLGLEFHGNISKADLIKLIEGAEGGQQPA